MSGTYKLEFEDNSTAVIEAVEKGALASLAEIAGEVEAQCKRKHPVGLVGGGTTKNSWKYKVIPNLMQAIVGNNMQTAVWLEFGTGDHALKGNGRKGGWYIPIGEGVGQISERIVKAYHFKVYYGKNGMKYAFTTGMKPKRILHNAVEKVKPKMEKIFKKNMGAIGK